MKKTFQRKNSRRPLNFEALENRDLLTAVYVTSEDDSGQGTFRHAMNLANLIPDVDRILFRGNVEEIVLNSPIQFLGPQTLTINGLNANIRPNNALDSFSLIESGGGGELRVRNLKLQGGDAGISVSVPANMQNDVKLVTANVQISEAYIGIRIIDAEERRDEEGNKHYGSDFGIFARIFNSDISDQLYRGVVVQEHGSGDIDLRIIKSNVSRNGGKGIEVLENGLGDMSGNIVRSTLSENVDEGAEFKEWNEGHQNVLILDSVFENNSIDNNFFGAALEETGEGDTRARVTRSKFIGNGNSSDSHRGDGRDTGGLRVKERQQGLLQIKAIDSEFNLSKRGNGIEFEERDAGPVRIYLDRVKVLNNESGIWGEEEDYGDLIFRANQLEVSNFFYYGIQIEEEDQGNANLVFESLVSTNRRTGEHFSHIQARARHEGELRFRVLDSSIESTIGEMFGGISFTAPDNVMGWFEDTTVTGNRNGIYVSQYDDLLDPGTVYLKNNQSFDNLDSDFGWQGIDPVWR